MFDRCAPLKQERPSARLAPVAAFIGNDCLSFAPTPAAWESGIALRLHVFESFSLIGPVAHFVARLDQGRGLICLCHSTPWLTSKALPDQMALGLAKVYRPNSCFRHSYMTKPGLRRLVTLTWMSFLKIRRWCASPLTLRSPGGRG